MPHSLITERLLVRPWRASDRAPFAELNADPEVMRYFPATRNRAESDYVADQISQHIAREGFGFWALEHRTTQEFLGFTGLPRVGAVMPFGPTVEIGWRLKRAAWGLGYATEAARASLRFGFNIKLFPEIVAFTALGNLPSQRVMERIGMQRDPDSFEHPSIAEGSPIRTHCLYRLTRSRWKDDSKLDVS